MANELKHKAVGTVLTQVEFEATDSHVFNSQATGDIVYASSSSQLSRLAKGSDNNILTLSSNIPAWTATPTLTTVDASTDFTVGTTVITDDVITFTPTTNDTVTMTAAANGAFSLVTVDTAAAAANIQITADGTVDIDSAGVLTLDSGAAINIEPAGGSAILLDGTISVDGGVVTGATSITSTSFVGALTGNASGTAATVTGAAQANITSLGTLTGLTLDGDKSVTPGDGAMIHLDTSTITDSNTSGSGTAALYTHARLEAPTLAATNSSVTTTNAATLYINAAATAGTNQTITNNYALLVAAGASKFASIVGTTIDASTDFTIGDTVITDGVITDSSGLQIAAAVDLNNNALSNVGAAGNDWTQNKLSIAGGTADQNLEVTTSGSSNWVQCTLAHPASGTGGVILLFKQGDGGGSANNMSYYVGYDGDGGYLKCRSRDTDGSSTDADIWRIYDGQLSIDANTTWDANVFDAYDDVGLIRSAISPTAEAYDFGQGALKRGRDVLIEIGVLKEYEDGFIGYNDQRMAALLAGGIYQTRTKVDELEQRLQALGG